MADDIDRTVPSIAGKVALVTGSGGVGMGRASAELFARSGASVVVSDINKEGGEETVERIRRAGGEATFIHVDVTDPHSVESLVAQTVERYGRLDCAHNHVGMAHLPKPMAELTLDEYDWIQSINTRSAFHCMKAEIEVMLRQGGGAIVQTASEAGVMPRPGLSAYAAGKHGVVGLCLSAASEYARQGIRINVVAPGATRSGNYIAALDDPVFGPMLHAEVPTLAMGRPGEPVEVASAVVWLSSDAASNVNGTVLRIDGGTRLPPG